MTKVVILCVLVGFFALGFISVATLGVLTWNFVITPLAELINRGGVSAENLAEVTLTILIATLIYGLLLIAGYMMLRRGAKRLLTSSREMRRMLLSRSESLNENRDLLVEKWEEYFERRDEHFKQMDELFEKLNILKAQIDDAQSSEQTQRR